MLSYQQSKPLADPKVSHQYSQRKTPVRNIALPYIEGWLKENEWLERWEPKQCWTAHRMWVELRKLGLPIGESTVRMYVREKQHTTKPAFVPLDVAPGEQAEFDFGEATVRTKGQKVPFLAKDAEHQMAPPLRVEDHLGLVMHIAKRYVGSYQGQHLLDLDDLFQEGVLGLMHAAEKFDARKGFRFSTYATYWIRWAIGQAIMNESRTIRLPTTIWPALQHLARAQADLWQQQQREPSLDELAEVMQCAKEQVLVLLQLQHDPVSLEQPVSSGDERVLLVDLLEAPDDTEQREQQATEVTDLLTYLTPQERQVIETRFQLGQTADAGNITLPYTEVSRQLDMTILLVKAVEERAFMKLRFWLAREKLALAMK